jgi:hypothetical protein
MDYFLDKVHGSAVSVSGGLVVMLIVNMVGRPVYNAFDKRYPEMGEFRERVEMVTKKVLDNPKVLFPRMCRPPSEDE